MILMEHLKKRTLTAVQNLTAVQKVTTLNPTQVKKESADATRFVPESRYGVVCLKKVGLTFLNIFASNIQADIEMF
jgi:hypothetical protein